MRVTIQSMRTLLFDLSPPTLEEEGLGSALTYLLENSELLVRLDGRRRRPGRGTGGPDLTHPVPHRAGGLRQRPEARAGVARIRVTLEPRDGGTSMQIVDDGVGFMPQEALVAAPGHLGLAAIRGRAEMAGGSSKLWSLPGPGDNARGVAAPRGSGPGPLLLARTTRTAVADVLPLAGRAAATAGGSAGDGRPCGRVPRDQS